MTTYITRQGDTLDQICHVHYGTERGGTTELVLETNRGLAEYGSVLPSGLRIELPAVSLPAQSEKMISLWD
jgi:phage tail protein X